MRVAIIRKRYTAFGGAERFIERLGYQLNKSGLTITILAETWNKSEAQPLEWIPIKTRGLVRVTRDQHFRKNVSQLLAKTEFDIIQTHERLLGADIYRVGDGLHIAWLNRYKQELNPLRRFLLDCDPFHRELLAIERKIAVESNTVFIANSELIAAELSDFYGVSTERIFIIPNGVDTGYFSVASSTYKSAQKKVFGFSEEDLVISFVGSGFFRKGLGELIAALKLLPPKVKLLVAGADRQTAQYQTQVNRSNLIDRVRFLGPVVDVRPVYVASDLFVLPTLYDPNSNAALEALSSGLPIVSTAEMGSMKEISAAKAGFISQRNAKSLARVISEALESPDIRLISENARHFAESIDESIVVQKWLRLYQNFQRR